MPLARDFFDVFYGLPIAEHPWVLQEGLIYYLKQELGVDPWEYLHSGVDIEDLHSRIAERLIDLGPSRSLQRIQMFKAYNELHFLFACTLNTVQNGPVSNAHTALARLLGPEDTVLTFNWDTLLDRALSEATDWRVDYGYSVVPARVFRGTWVDADCPRAPRQAPDLLKLHGSVNWLVGHPILDEHGGIGFTQAASPSQFSVFERADGPYNTFAGRHMDGYGPFTYGYYPPNLDVEGRRAPEGYSLLSARLKFPWRPEGTSGAEGLASMPLIIPPVKQKTYEIFGDLFTSLWRTAEDALAAATHIVIVGYSFPRTDHRSVTLFKQAFLRRRTVPHVTIIDPYPDPVAALIELELGVRRDHLTILQTRFDTTLSLGSI